MKKSIFIVSLAAFLVALSICVTSCKKDPDPIPQKVMLPVEFVYDNNHEGEYGELNGLVIEMTYDDKNRIVSFNRFYSRSGQSYEYPLDYILGDYVYNSSGELTDITWKGVREGDYETIQVQRYTYSDNFVTSTHEFLTSQPYPLTKYELQNDRMVKEYSYRDGDFQEFKTFSHDASGNITKILNHKDNHSELISYDNKKGILSGINKPNWALWGFIEPFGSHTVNNPLKREFSYGKSTVYEYLEYNSYGYPTKIKVNGLAEVEIKYIEAK